MSAITTIRLCASPAISSYKLIPIALNRNRLINDDRAVFLLALFCINPGASDLALIRRRWRMGYAFLSLAGAFRFCCGVGLALALGVAFGVSGGCAVFAMTMTIRRRAQLRLRRALAVVDVKS